MAFLSSASFAQSTTVTVNNNTIASQNFVCHFPGYTVHINIAANTNATYSASTSSADIMNHMDGSDNPPPPHQPVTYNANNVSTLANGGIRVANVTIPGPPFTSATNTVTVHYMQAGSLVNYTVDFN
ncbi:MAG: hypothetical protein COA58_10265 [Bacteroidetes bacterium]|nr:MAG: hypothetical protein COA58_10265 [Bacteroidota bacterium]